jgi:hypothetical protein
LFTRGERLVLGFIAMSVKVNLSRRNIGIISGLVLSRVPCVGEVIWPDVSKGPGYLVEGVMHFPPLDPVWETVDADLEVREISRDEPLPYRKDEGD